MLDLRLRHRSRAAIDDLPLLVASSGRDSERDRRTVCLVRVEKLPAELGGLAEEARQEARCQRIERAGVAGLCGAIEPARPLERRVRGQPARLVQKQHTVDRLPGGGHRLRRRRGVRRAASLATASSIRCVRRMPCSTDASYAKRNSGTLWILSRAPSIVRRKPAARCNPAVCSASVSAGPSDVKNTLAWARSGEISTPVSVIMPTRGSLSSVRRISDSSRWISPATRRA